MLVLAPRLPRELVEKVPVLYSPDACSTAAMEYGRVREGYALELALGREDDLEQWGWDAPDGL